MLKLFCCIEDKYLIFPEIHATLETEKTKEQERVFMEENKMGTIPVSRLVIFHGAAADAVTSD